MEVKVKNFDRSGGETSFGFVQFLERARTRDAKALREVYFQLAQLQERRFVFHELCNGAYAHGVSHAVDFDDPLEPGLASGRLAWLEEHLGVLMEDAAAFAEAELTKF